VVAADAPAPGAFLARLTKDREPITPRVPANPVPAASLALELAQDRLERDDRPNLPRTAFAHRRIEDALGRGELIGRHVGHRHAFARPGSVIPGKPFLGLELECHASSLSGVEAVEPCL
jgi:hypothetical protein